MLIGELLRRRAELTGEREAVLDTATGARYSFAQLEARALRTATALAQLGVGRGDRVALLAENGIEYLDLLFGAAELGAMFVPLNWRSVPRELVAVLSDCEPVVLLHGPEYAPVVAEVSRAASTRSVPVESLATTGAGVPSASDASSVSGTSSASESSSVSGTSSAFESSSASGNSALSDASSDSGASSVSRVSPVSDDDPCCILYTSGTTGRPKGAMIPHRQVVANCVNVVSCWGVGETDVASVQTPMFHTGGLFVFLLPLLYVGGRVVLSRGSASGADLRLIEREQCTVVLGVPTLFRLWQQSQEFATVDLSHVRFFISGGAPCPVSVMETWRREKSIVFRQGYGLTEVGPNCFTMTDAESVSRAGSVGKPMLNSRARVVDAHARDVETGEVGELVLAGPHVFAGYWRNPTATSAALRDGWFWTGDMARVDDAGFFTIVGRSKDMLISGGENVYAAEVEAVARECPGVEDAALVAEEHEKWGEVGVLAVCGEAGLAPTAVLEFCAGKLARYKIPKRVVVVEDLPRSAYGKVLKAELGRQLGIEPS